MAIVQGNLNSSTLLSYTKRFNLNGANYKPEQIFIILVTRILIDSFEVNKALCAWHKNVEILFTIIEELLKNGLKGWLNFVTDSDPLLRTVDFVVDDKTFIDWLIDLVDCTFIQNTPEAQPPYNRFSYFGEKIEGKKRTGIFSREFSLVRGTAIKMEMFPYPSTLKIEYNISKKRKSNGKSSRYHVKGSIDLPNEVGRKAGVTDIEFRTLDEDSQEEWDCCYSYDRESIEYLEFDDSIKLKNFGYKIVYTIDWTTITGCRGFAQNMIYAGSCINPDAMTVKGRLNLFKKTEYSINPYQHFFDRTNYLLFVGNKSTNVEIPGYRKLTYDEMLREVLPSKYKNEQIIFEGETLSKLEALKNPQYLSKLETIDDYYNQVAGGSVTDELFFFHEKHQFIAENFHMDNKYNIQVKELENMITKYKNNQVREKKNKDEEDKEEKTSDIHEKINLKNLLEEMSEKNKDLLNMVNVEVEPNIIQPINKNLVRELEREQRMYQFQKKMQVLSDQGVRSEICSIFKNYWDPLVNGEIILSENALKDRVDLALMKINRMNDLEAKKDARALLLVVQYILTLCNKGKTTNQFSSKFCTDIDELFVREVSENNEDIAFYQLPVTERVEIPYNIDFID